MGGVQKPEVDVASAFGNEVSGFFRPFATRDGIRVFYKILKTGILRPFSPASCLPLRKRHLRFNVPDGFFYECILPGRHFLRFL